jgi:hypothetical protein
MRYYTLQITLTHRLAFSVMLLVMRVDAPVLLGSRPRRLAATSHQPPTLLPPDSQDCRLVIFEIVT